MRKVTCEKGHSFDADRFSICPVCGASPAGNVSSENTVQPKWLPQMKTDNSPPEQPQSSLHSFFSWRARRKQEKEEKAVDAQEASAPAEPPAVPAVDELAPTAWMSPDQIDEQEVSVPAEPPAVPAVDELAPTAWISPDQIEEQEVSAPAKPPAVPAVDELAPTAWISPDQIDEQEVSAPAEPPTMPAVDELAPTAWISPDQMDEQEVSAPAEPPAVPAVDTSESSAVPTAEEKKVTSLEQAVAATGSADISPLPRTQAYYDFDSVEAPVGWVVGLSGTYQGRALECYAGRNRIGRAQGMEILLTDEPSISRVNHAALIYEPRERRFYLQAGMGDSLTYLNGSLLFDHAELHRYDRITLGKAEFVFLPLCGPEFSWDEVLKEGGRQ